MFNKFSGSTPITTATVRMTEVVNANYGLVYAIYFDAAGHEVARTHSPGEYGPHQYAHKIVVTLHGAQPQNWSQRAIQDRTEWDGQ
jgi:hypothetical protein